MSGKIDAAVTDGVFIDYYAIHTPKTFRVLNDHVPERGFAVGVDPANKELLTQINKALSDMEADGTAQAIYKKWFSEKKWINAMVPDAWSKNHRMMHAGFEWVVVDSGYLKIENNFLFF